MTKKLVAVCCGRRAMEIISRHATIVSARRALNARAKFGVPLEIWLLDADGSKSEYLRDRDYDCMPDWAEAWRMCWPAGSPMQTADGQRYKE